MMPFRRNSLAAQRFAERRRREDEAPRLCEQVPTLRSLRIDIKESFGSGATKYTRRYILSSARALFLVPCVDPRCADGEHDLTYSVMHALRARETSFHGSDDCPGNIGSSVCLRVVQFDGSAEYAA